MQPLSSSGDFTWHLTAPKGRRLKLLILLNTRPETEAASPLPYSPDQNKHISPGSRGGGIDSTSPWGGKLLKVAIFGDKHLQKYEQIKAEKA